MAPAAVYLHIGSPKTGTTYIQNVLWANRATLEADGVLLPGGHRFARVEAARALIKWEPGEGDLPKAWRQLTNEVNEWSGRSAIISQEFLCSASAQQVETAVQSFRKSRVEIVLTVRDLARLVPAQWQTAMRQRHTWTLQEYAKAVAEQSEGEAKAAARHFWRRHDYGPILRRWMDVTGKAQVHVVTVPPSGGDPDELWLRFCRACDLDSETTTPGGMSHESLGAVSAELMRRLNSNPAIEEMPKQTYQKSVNGALTRKVLQHRRSQEPGLALPEGYSTWAETEAERLIGDIESAGVEVIGSLDDLRPRPGKQGAALPEEVPAEELLEAALDGLAGLATQHAALLTRVQRAERPINRKTKVVTPVQRDPLTRLRRGISRARKSWRRRRAGR